MKLTLTYFFFRQGNILYYKDTDDAIRKVEIARFITQAIAYQWLDNVLTVSWWSETWLNEGFAVHLQVNALNEVALLFLMQICLYS